MDSQDFCTGLVAEMHQIFAQLGEHETLESESQGNVAVVPLLKAALKSELEASERDLLHGAALEAATLPATEEGDAPPGAYTCC